LLAYWIAEEDGMTTLGPEVGASVGTSVGAGEVELRTCGVSWDWNKSEQMSVDISKNIC
jgi:hypothetical protein